MLRVIYVWGMDYKPNDIDWISYDLGDGIIIYEAPAPGGYVWEVENTTVHLCLFEGDFKQSFNVELVAGTLLLHNCKQ